MFYVLFKFIAVGNSAKIELFRSKSLLPCTKNLIRFILGFSLLKNEF